MAYKLIVNIKKRYGGEFVRTLIREEDHHNSMEFLYRKAINAIQNYFKKELDPLYEIHKGKDSTIYNSYWRVQPRNYNEKATIVIKQL